MLLMVCKVCSLHDCENLLILDDSWINITSEQLDEMLNNAYGKYTPSTVTDLSKVAERMKTFVDSMSSHEGVEFPGFVQKVVFQADVTFRFGIAVGLLFL